MGFSQARSIIQLYVARMSHNSMSFYGRNITLGRKTVTTGYPRTMSQAQVTPRCRSTINHSHSATHSQGRRSINPELEAHTSLGGTPVSRYHGQHPSSGDESQRRSTSDTYEPGMLIHDHPSTALHTDFRSENELIGSESEFDPSPQSFTPSSSTCPNPSSYISPVNEQMSGDMRVLLQQQQGLLMRILNNQAAMEDKQAHFEAKLTELERKLSTPVSSDSPAFSSGEKRKQVVSQSLSV